ncbi:MAG: hypothetical protein E7317_02715 [Clostridiales bacterium]|nr:hypothetical protein [Clostridiales bacterium]
MADSDGKVVIDIELDDSHVRSDVNRVASTIQQGLNANQSKTRVNVTADVSGALGQIQSVRAAANDVNDARPTVNVSANTDAADSQLDATRNKANEVEDADPFVDIRTLTDTLGNTDPTVNTECRLLCFFTMLLAIRRGYEV